jgi:outer membrane murein-binding lipoprotein Lpp
MSMFSPDFWKQWDVFMNAPYVIIMLLALALLTGWWVGQKQERARKNALSDAFKNLNAQNESLNTQIGNLDAHIKALNQQLNLAKDRDEDVRRANVEIARRVAELEVQIGANVSKEVLSAKVQELDTAIIQLATANTALEAVLKAQEVDHEASGIK